MALEAFKPNDPVEAKVLNAFLAACSIIALDLDEYYDGCDEAFPFGDVLFDTGHPLAGVLTKEVFRTSYPAIHELFTRAGSFEFYLSVFRSVWGEDVEIEFTIPAPGKLEINIEALAATGDDALARSIVDDVYVYDELTTDAGDNLIFQGSTGIKTQRETDALVRELHPAGVWVEATLSIT